jgi:hypothetical protein
VLSWETIVSKAIQPSRRSLDFRALVVRALAEGAVSGKEKVLFLAKKRCCFWQRKGAVSGKDNDPRFLRSSIRTFT